ncbi:MAG: hypothetical protein KA535_03360 [Azonexus sp.]|nr:hypothetical protein [Azonexus sp.]
MAPEIEVPAKPFEPAEEKTENEKTESETESEKVLTLEEAKAIAEAALVEVASDPGAIWLDENLEAFRVIYQQDKPEYMRFRAKLKAMKGVVITDWEKEVKRKQGDGTLNEKPTHHDFAKTVISDLTVNFYKPVGNIGKLFVVNETDSTWKGHSPDQLAVYVAERFNGVDGCATRRQYLDIADHSVSVAEDEKFFDGAPIGLACPKGFYRVADGVLKPEPLTPGHRQTVLVPYSPEHYGNPETTMGVFWKFLGDTFYPVEDRSESAAVEAQAQIALLQEIIGATLLGLTAAQEKVIFFYERYGRAGKGTMLKIIEALIPKEARSAISPEKWSNEYYLAEMAGMKLNTTGEVSNQHDDAIKGHAFKDLIGRDMVTARHIHGSPFSYRNTATHIVAGNCYPATKDHSDAFYNRWIIVSFPNSRTKLNLPIDTGLAEYIIQKELPYISMWGLEGAIRLIQNKQFTVTNTHLNHLSEWRKRANSLMMFVDERCILGKDNWSLKSTFNIAYQDWCKENGFRHLSARTITEGLIETSALGIAVVRHGDNDYYRGVLLRT